MKRINKLKIHNSDLIFISNLKQTSKLQERLFFNSQGKIYENTGLFEKYDNNKLDNIKLFSKDLGIDRTIDETSYSHILLYPRNQQGKRHLPIAFSFIEELGRKISIELLKIIDCIDVIPIVPFIYMDEKLKLAYKKLILINSLLTNNLHYRIFITEGPGPQCATALSIEREVDELFDELGTAIRSLFENQNYTIFLNDLSAMQCITEQ